MPVLISFLRGINVGGHKKIKMADLRQLYVSLALDDVRSILQSGNVVFRTGERDLTRLRKRIEAGIQNGFGFEVRVILRGARDYRDLIARQPFDDEQLSQGGKISVVFLDSEPSDLALADLIDSNPGAEIIHANATELYIYYGDGKAGSKLDNSRVERRLQTIASARNWNTCLRLLKLLNEYEP